MTRHANEIGAPCLRKALRRTCAMVSLLIVGVLGILPIAGASATQHPRAVRHSPPPFGDQHKAVCPSAAGKAHCLAMVVTSGSAQVAVVRNMPFGYGPVDLQTAYNLTSLSASRGVGQTVAIVDAYDDPAAESDLATYRSTYGLSACTTANGCFKKIDQRGGTSYPVTDLGWSEEISLDLDMVSAIAPNTHIMLIEADSASFADLAAAVNEAAALGATQISNSYGGSEAGSSFASAYNHPGIAITASAGDCGYDNESIVGSCSSVPPGANFPATVPTVEAIGGTSLYTTSPRAEAAWSGAGSGCSSVFSKPAWQSDAGCALRMEGDLSAVADPATGVAVYDSLSPIGGFAVFGGTSASSPIIASFDALVGPTVSSPRFFYQHPGLLNDVTTGSNGTCSDYECNAGVGYDGPTGFGTPNGANLLACSSNPIINTNPSGQTVTAPGGVLFTAVAANPASCSTLSVQWQISTNGGASWANDTSDSGSTTNTLSINPTSTSQSGNEYRAAFTNEHGTTDSTVATLTVNAPTSPPPPPQAPPSATAAPHVNGAALAGATLSVSTGFWTGAPDAYDYVWSDCPSANGGCSEVSRGAASYTTRAGDANGHVYAEVRAHNAGGWSGFVRSDNTIAPQSGRPGGGSHPGVLSIGRVTVSGASASVPLRCSGDTSCQATVSLTVTETLRGHQLIAVSAAKVTHKVVVLARVSLTLGAGQSKTVKATLGPAGRRLLPRRTRMKLKLTITQSGRPMSVKTLVFARR